MAYADYEYYSETFLGDVIAQADFPKLAKRASDFIDEITFGRAADETGEDVVGKIKDAVCAIAEFLSQQPKDFGIVESEKVGDVSMTYRGARTVKGLQRAIAAQYLARTGIMYGGPDDVD